MRAAHRGLVIVAHALIAFAPMVWVRSASAASIDDLTVKRVGARYLIQLHAHLNARATVAYAVFANLANLPAINTDVKRIQITGGRDGAPVQLYTQIRACVLWYCRTIRETQEMTFAPRPGGGDVSARVLPNGDLRYGRARWEFRAAGDQTQFDASAELEPAFPVPPLIGPWIVKRWLRLETKRSSENLEQLTRVAAGSRGSEPQIEGKTN